MGGEVALGERLHHRLHAPDRTDDAAHDDPGETDHDQQGDRDQAALAQRGGAEHGVDVVDVDPRADEPVPLLEALDVGGLGHRFGAAGLGPGVIDEAAALLAHQAGHLDDEGAAVGVLEVGEILAEQLRAGRMHQHPVVHVVDPEVFLAVVAQLLERRHRRRARGFVAHLAGARARQVAGDHAVRDLDHVARLQLAVLEQVVAQHDQPERDVDDVAEDCERDQQADLVADLQVLHEASPGAGRGAVVRPAGCRRSRGRRAGRG